MKGKTSKDARAGVRAENAGGKKQLEAGVKATGAGVGEIGARAQAKTDDRTEKKRSVHVKAAFVDGDAESEKIRGTAQKAETQAPAGTRKQKREWTQLDRYRRLIKERMTALGVYKPQYMALIERTAKLYVMLAKLEKEYEKSDMEPYIEYTNKAGHTNLIPNPMIKSIEDAYAELMLHERELGLTPAAMRKMGAAAEAPKEKSPLEAALEKLSGG